MINNVQIIKDGSMRDRDPSLTLTLRTTLASKYAGRFRKISAEIRNKIVNENYFNATQQLSVQNSHVISLNQYIYPSSPEKISGFMDYINLLIEQNIFEMQYVWTATMPENQMWSSIYITTAYQKGLERSRQDLIKMGFGLQLPAADTAIAAYMGMGVHIDALKTAYIRQFEAMKGITSVMSAQISHVLTQGIAEGRSPLELARNIANRIDKIGITRAKMIARTEIVRAYNIATLLNFEQLDKLITDDLMVQWWTALDERVRSKHRHWHGDIITTQKATTRIGEPNCRCSIIPYIASINEGESLNIPYDGWVQIKPDYER